MSRRFSEIVFLFLIGLTIAIAPIACSSEDSTPTDGGRDVNSMTPG